MKSVLVIQIIVICFLLTVFSVFTIDGVNVKKAELQQIVVCDVADIVDKYFNEESLEGGLEGEIKNAILESAHSKIDKLNVLVHYADASKGVVSFTIEEVYKQPNGSYRMVSMQKVYIREIADNPETSAYDFTRNISKEYYKNNAGTFIPEENGGLKANSIWRTPEYSLVLDIVFSD